MTVEPTPALRPLARHRADVPEGDALLARVVRPAVAALAAAFVLIGGANLDLGPADARVALASGDPVGPFGRTLGFWDPSTWPASVALGRLWAWGEEAGPTQGAVRWPAAIAGVLIGFVLARRGRERVGPRAGLIIAACWYGSFALMDRSAALGLDLIAGLGTILALDRLLSRGAGWSVGLWAAFAFLAGGWPPLAVLGLATLVLGRSGATWSWSMTIPIALAVAAWSAWALTSAPAEAWASALTLPITQPSAWGMALGAVACGCPWAPFAALGLSRSVRDGFSNGARPLALGWLQVAGACLIVGSVVPGLASAALAPALAGLAFAAGACWASAWDGLAGFSRGARRWLFGSTLGIAGAWLAVVLSWGGYIGFSVAYYRAVMIAVAASSVVAFLYAVAATRKGDPRRALVAMGLVAVALKLAHWGYYAPEWNYRNSAGPWGRAIGQWVPDKHPVYTLHAWPLDLAFAIGRPVRQLASPQHIEFAPGKGSKFVLLRDTEYAEYLSWSDNWPKLIKVAEFQDELGLSRRVLTRTDAPLIIDRPYRKPAPE